MMLYPTRIVFAGNQRAAQLELINNGTESATYRISLVNRRMSETGAFSGIDVPLPGEQFAEDMLRYSPRQVTLAPGAGQAVRIMVRKPANLAPGEYRSHMLFAKQPNPEGRTSVESSNATADNEIGITLTALVGASIPVIVRHGNTDASVALTHLDLRRPADKAPVLGFVMERSGNQSVYGDLTISFTPYSGSEQVIARANGVAIYTPNPLRRASISLGQLNGSRLTNGALRVTYREQAEDGGALLVETVLQLP
ncbi:fimbrial biogenesis chaperone [Marinobacter psychrophilus]|nr:molecular chaperone [Marinobacter psychrophilus]